MRSLAAYEYAWGTAPKSPAQVAAVLADIRGYFARGNYTQIDVVGYPCRCKACRGESRAWGDQCEVSILSFGRGAIVAHRRVSSPYPTDEWVCLTLDDALERVREVIESCEASAVLKALMEGA